MAVVRRHSHLYQAERGRRIKASRVGECYTSNLSYQYSAQILQALDIAKGLAFLHAWTPPIYHADVKPVSHAPVFVRHKNSLRSGTQANTLVNECERGMLCDFGLSKALDDTPSGLTTTKVNFTIRYASPELLLHTTQSISNDTWAWGCFLLEVSARTSFVVTRSDSSAFV